MWRKMTFRPLERLQLRTSGFRVHTTNTKCNVSETELFASVYLKLRKLLILVIRTEQDAI